MTYMKYLDNYIGSWPKKCSLFFIYSPKSVWLWKTIFVHNGSQWTPKFGPHSLLLYGRNFCPHSGTQWGPKFGRHLLSLNGRNLVDSLLPDNIGLSLTGTASSKLSLACNIAKLKTKQEWTSSSFCVLTSFYRVLLLKENSTSPKL